MVFEKIIRQNVEQAVSLCKQTNSLFYAFPTKSFVEFNFQRPLAVKSVNNFKLIVELKTLNTPEAKFKVILNLNLPKSNVNHA